MTVIVHLIDHSWCFSASVSLCRFIYSLLLKDYLILKTFVQILPLILKATLLAIRR